MGVLDPKSATLTVYHGLKPEPLHWSVYEPAAPAAPYSTRSFTPEPDMLGSAVKAIGVVSTVGVDPDPPHNVHSMSFADVVMKLGESIFVT